MQDPKKLGEPETAATPVEDEPQKGGFGALADVYPARWVGTHRTCARVSTPSRRSEPARRPRPNQIPVACRPRMERDCSTPRVPPNG